MKGGIFHDKSSLFLGVRRDDDTGSAVVRTTIPKGKLLSFAFVTNSPEQLKKLTESEEHSILLTGKPQSVPQSEIGLLFIRVFSSYPGP